MVNLLAAAAALAGAAFAAPAPQTHALPRAAVVEDANPAMFVVRDADTTIYIFGTYHALDGRSRWFKGPVRHAFDVSDELVLETVIPDGPVQLSPRPMFNGRPLPMSPSASFAATRMAVDAGRSQGQQVANGADMVLRRAAESVGKPVEGLETPEAQYNMFQRMPDPDPQPYDADAERRAVDNLRQTLSVTQAAWKRGDQTVFAQVLEGMRRNSPESYRLMFTERNARWADWIAGRMQTPGVVFVAVGAGHLAGRDSLLVRLAQLGIVANRVN